MNYLINEWFFLVMFNCVTGLAAYLLWKLVSRFLEKKGQYGLIKHTGRLVVALYIVPIVYLRYIKRASGAGKYQPGLMKTINVCRWGSISDVTPTLFFIMECLFIIWAAGILVQLIKYLKSKSAFKGFLDSASPANDMINVMKEQIAGELELKEDINVFVHSGTKVPFVTGVKNPAVYIPASDYSEQELKVILYHEIVHIKHRDLLAKKVIMLLKLVYWFNPFIYRLERDMDSMEETCCDEKVCRAKHVVSSYKDYFRVILDNVEKGLSNTSFMMGLKNGADELKKRMMRMSHSKSVMTIRNTWAVVFAVIFMAGSSLSAAAMSDVIEQGYTCVLNATDEKAVEICSYSEDSSQAVCETPKELSLMESSSFATNTDGRVSESALTVPPNTRIEINSAFIRSGNEVFICAFQDDDSAMLGVGLISDDGTRYEKKNEYPYRYEFTINKTGMYKIYVENYSSESVKVDFNYIFVILDN